MKQIKRLAAGFAAAALALCAALPALAAPTVDQTRAVMDTADILTADTETYITNISVALQEECGAQIGVYTVEYIGNNTMEGYAYEVFNEWGLGDADKDNGVLFLMSPGEDNYWITRGSGLEQQLSVSTLNSLFDSYTEPNWVAGDFDACARQTTAALAEKLCRLYGLSMDVDAVGWGTANTAAPARQSGGGAAIFLVIFAIVLLILLVVWLSGRNRRSPPPPPTGGGSSTASNLFWYSMGRSAGRRTRRPPPPPPPPRPGPGPGPRPGGFGGPGPRPGGFGGPGGAGRPSAPRPSSPRPSAPRPSSPRPSSGGFRAGGGSSRGGGAGRR